MVASMTIASTAWSLMIVRLVVMITIQWPQLLVLSRPRW
ncbi:putative proline-rich receptor-like protein kinase PERK3 [Iris pallida]|uniref:Proline-rich receptor-like protein kinase PERK3 n=1 Tax=Iris pallida TaxID=29817 RepID=A0AAX6FNN4_IRIPA|nr:putative proline-rich receptor-like protein kinase PERK3 [Iris pallida]